MNKTKCDFCVAATYDDKGKARCHIMDNTERRRFCREALEIYTSVLKEEIKVKNTQTQNINIK